MCHGEATVINVHRSRLDSWFALSGSEHTVFHCRLLASVVSPKQSLALTRVLNQIRHSSDAGLTEPMMLNEAADRHEIETEPP